MENVIVLNVDHSFHQTVDWRDAVCMILKGVAEPVTKDKILRTVRSVSLEIKVPKVIRLVKYIYLKFKDNISFQRRTVYLRDNYTCQYCGKTLRRNECTLDHVVPKVLGGKSSYANCVTACGPCNLKKGSKTHMKPMKPPKNVTPALYLRLKSKDIMNTLDGFNSV